jgi:hypothetical protein
VSLVNSELEGKSMRISVLFVVIGWAYTALMPMKGSQGTQKPGYFLFGQGLGVLSDPDHHFKVPDH